MTTNPFFAATRLGAQDACGLLGCTYEWTGSVNAVVSEMTGALHAAIDAKADGIAVDAGSTSAIAVLSRQNGLARRGMATGGFDLLPTTIAAIAGGDLGFTIDQQPYQQGFYPIAQLYLYKISNTLMYPSDTNTGLKFVTRANVGTYSTPSHFEGNG